MLRVSNLVGFGARRAAGTFSTFDPATKGFFASLSNGDRDLSNTVAFWGSARGTQSRNSGLMYVEFKLVALTFGSFIRIGLCAADYPLGSRLGDTANAANSFGVFDDNGLGISGSLFSLVESFSAVTWAAGDTIQLAVNFDNGSVWLGRNNTWRGATPSSGTTGRWLSFTPGATLFPGGSVFSTGNTIQLNTGTSNQTYAPPADFISWG